MFEFFIALFGGLFYGGKILHESSNHRAFELHIETSRVQRECLGDRDIEPTYNLMDRLKTPEERERLLESIEEDLLFVFGEGWVYDLSTYLNASYSHIGDSSWSMAFHILLSKEGRIPWLSSYSLNFIGSKLRRDKIIKACMVVERNIQQYYPELEMLFKPDGDVGLNKTHRYRYNGILDWSFCFRDKTGTYSLSQLLEHNEIYGRDDY